MIINGSKQGRPGQGLLNRLNHFAVVFYVTGLPVLFIVSRRLFQSSTRQDLAAKVVLHRQHVLLLLV